MREVRDLVIGIETIVNFEDQIGTNQVFGLDWNWREKQHQLRVWE